MPHCARTSEFLTLSRLETPRILRKHLCKSTNTNTHTHTRTKKNTYHAPMILRRVYQLLQRDQYGVHLLPESVAPCQYRTQARFEHINTRSSLLLHRCMFCRTTVALLSGLIGSRRLCVSQLYTVRFQHLSHLNRTNHSRVTRDNANIDVRHLVA